MALENQIWAEKFRPKTIDHCILPERIKEQARGFVKSPNMTSLLFTGSAGVGKTTLARAIAFEMEADFMQINASLDASMDNIRTDISKFASTVSFTNSKKITLLDEADGLTTLQQQALRGFIEEYSSNHTIIFTCNFINKISDAIKSRCKIIDFKVSKSEKLELATQFVQRVYGILDQEAVAYSKQVVAQLVMKKFPDFRSVLNELQGYSAGGKIDAGVLLDISDARFDPLICSLKDNKFSDMRRWVGENSDIDSDSLFKIFYDKASEKVEAKSLPEMVLLIGEYSYRSAFVVNQEINTAAFLTSIMLSNIAWK